jgi:hypothetical protein
MGLTPFKAGCEFIHEFTAPKRYKSATFRRILHMFYIVLVMPIP